MFYPILHKKRVLYVMPVETIREAADPATGYRGGVFCISYQVYYENANLRMRPINLKLSDKQLDDLHDMMEAE